MKFIYALAAYSLSVASAHAATCAFTASPQDPVVSYSCEGQPSKAINSPALKVDASDYLQISTATVKYFETQGYTIASCSQRGDALNCLMKK